MARTQTALHFIGAIFFLLATVLSPSVAQAPPKVPSRPHIPTRRPPVHLPGRPAAPSGPTNAQFFFVSYLGKCLDVGAGLNDEHAAVSTTRCTQGGSQRIEIKEVGPDREVNLMANGKCLGPALNSIIQQMPLALRACDNSDFQKFILDGDSIIAATERDIVVEVRTSGGTARGQLWLNHRDLDDPEFWSITAAGTDARPTSGFVNVPGDADLTTALTNATAGSVIQLNQDFVVPPGQKLTINAGVTLRGGRQDINMGPQLSTTASDDNGTFIMKGEYPRITGLRILGPSRDPNTTLQAVGIVIDDSSHTIVDHNDISDWPTASVQVNGSQTADCVDKIAGGSLGNGTPVEEPWDVCCTRVGVPRDHRTHVSRVLIARNFIHHNRKQERGYGVVVNKGAYPLVEANTFLDNRHSITADGLPFTGYSAIFNLVLSTVPLQKHVAGIISWHTQDFDVHGRFKAGDYSGSAAGNHTEIMHNTFFGVTGGSNSAGIGIGDHPNFHLRGTPCDSASYVDNISLHNRGDAVNYDGQDRSLKLTMDPDDKNFSRPNPTTRFGIGDFDGDGYDDLFITTGTAWYYAPRGRAEWRFLRADTVVMGNLLFGDFDGDGRTDVFMQSGSDWMVSWGGRSDWEKIGTHAEPSSEYRIGDFDGDGKSDIFYASGTEWLVSSGATGPFVRLRQATERSSQVRIGEFTRDTKTDVLVPSDDGWTIYPSGSGPVRRVHRNDKPKRTIAEVADFDGDGVADVTSILPVHGPKMEAVQHAFVSDGGIGAWVVMQSTNSATPNVGYGRFLDKKRVDILMWDGNGLKAYSAVTKTATQLSRQDMR